MMVWSWCLIWCLEIGCYWVLLIWRLIGYFLFCCYLGLWWIGYLIGCCFGWFCLSYFLIYFFDILFLCFGIIFEKYIIMKMLFYLSYYYIFWIWNVWICLFLLFIVLYIYVCFVSYWIKFWYEVNKKNYIYGILLCILVSKDVISYL